MKEGSSQVEINGRVYDAKTGQTKRIKHSKPTVISTRKVVDGIIPKSALIKPVDTSKPRLAHPTSAKAVHSKTERTKRLHPAIRNSARASLEKAKVIKRFSSKSSAKRRAKHAKEQPKSNLIRRHHYQPTEESVPPPVQEDKIEPAAPIMLPKRRPVVDSVQPTPPPKALVSVPETNPPQLSWIRRHLIPAAASFATLALVSGFLIYNSLPKLTMQVASSRAGFNANIPNYHPSGYEFEGPVSYGPGRVIIKYDSRTDDKSYTVTQKESSWDSKSLLDNYLAENAENYLTFEENGLTVYLYDNSRATWVDNGVWYEVSGDAHLNSEQLLKIASSL